MSGKLLSLKKAIKATKTTKKMTKAMELVASSKMRAFQNKASGAINYTSNVEKIISLGVLEEYYNESIFVKSKDVGSTLVIIYSSDKGLCGSMNTRIFRTLMSWEGFKNKENKYVVIGKKGRKFAKNNNLNVVDYYSDLSDSTSHLDLVEIVDSVLKVYKDNNIKDVVMITPNFKSTLVFYPDVTPFLPLKLDELNSFKSDDDTSLGLHKFEPTRSAIFDKALELFIVSKFYSAFLDLKAVEYSTRMIAMKNATTAADDRIDSLTLSFNKARQAAITQEITEIINGGGD